MKNALVRALAKALPLSSAAAAIPLLEAALHGMKGASCQDGAILLAKDACEVLMDCANRAEPLEGEQLHEIVHGLSGVVARSYRRCDTWNVPA